MWCIAPLFATAKTSSQPPWFLAIPTPVPTRSPDAADGSWDHEPQVELFGAVWVMAHALPLLSTPTSVILPLPSRAAARPPASRGLPGGVSPASASQVPQPGPRSSGQPNGARSCTPTTPFLPRSGETLRDRPTWHVGSATSMSTPSMSPQRSGAGSQQPGPPMSWTPTSPSSRRASARSSSRPIPMTCPPSTPGSRPTDHTRRRPRGGRTDGRLVGGSRSPTP